MARALASVERRRPPNTTQCSALFGRITLEVSMLTIAGLLTAPLLATSPRRPKKAVEDSASMTLVVVQNDRNVPVTVYVQNDQNETRLATVAPLTDTTIRIPSYLTDE